MDIECFPKLSKTQEKNLPKDYVPPPIEGTYSVNNKHPEGIIYIYVGYCDWEKNFNHCLKEFILTIFHETLHILCPEIENHIPHAEKILAEILKKK
jgi:hypothetical protein